MSYEIVYNSKFIKLGDKIIPLTLHGSNNCTETTWSGRERRTRDWSAMYFNGENKMIDKTESEIMDTIKSYIGGEYQQHFMKNGKYVDDKGLISFFKNRIKNAKTLEELQEEYYGCNVLTSYLSIWGEEFSHRIENRIFIHNSNELQEFLNNSKVFIENKNEKENVYVCLQFQCEDFKPKQQKAKTAKERLTEFFAITVHGCGYLTKLTSRRIKYTDGINSSVKQFKSETDAKNYLEHLLERGFKCELDIKHITV